MLLSVALPEVLSEPNAFFSPVEMRFVVESEDIEKSLVEAGCLKSCAVADDDHAPVDTDLIYQSSINANSSMVRGPSEARYHTSSQIDEP
jgi:hypothetical protein